MRTSERLLAGSVCVGFVSLSLAHVFLLPPYEGFDETAHYSYVSALADRHLVPDFRSTLLDETIQRETEGLPHPYGGTPPYDPSDGQTYAGFFRETSAEDRQRALDHFWNPPNEPAEYQPGGPTNWQGQHPPLYYALMALPYSWTKTCSPGVRLLVLRLVSTAMACGSLWFWWRSVQLFASRRARRLLLLAGAIVLWLPSCWFDLARLGNDALAALALSATIYYLLRTHKHRQQRVGDFLALAIALGCGLWTKAFFVPIAAGSVGFLGWSWLRRYGAVTGPLLLVVLVGLIAAPWFLFYHHRYGTWLGSEETYRLVQEGNAATSLSVLEFARQMGRSATAFGATFLWSGTWSWVKRPFWHYGLILPLLLLALHGLFRCRQHIRGGHSGQILMAAAFLLVPLLAGFGYHMYLRVKHTGVGAGTGGYYLFLAWPLVGVFLGQALNMGRSRLNRAILVAALALAVCFELSGVWFSAQVYAGIVEKSAPSGMGVGAVFPTPEHVAEVFRRLEPLVFPRLAIAMYLLSIAARIAAIRAIARPATAH